MYSACVVNGSGYIVLPADVILHPASCHRGELYLSSLLLQIASSSSVG